MKREQSWWYKDITLDDLAKAAELLPRLVGCFWVIHHGDPWNWKCGPEKPDPVPNLSMPWRRPDVVDVAIRSVFFREDEQRWSKCPGLRGEPSAEPAG